MARGVPARVRRGGPAGVAGCGGFQEEAGVAISRIRRPGSLGDVVVTVAREGAAESVEDVPF